MKKYFLVILSYISIITASNADAVTDYISNLIPGDGDTELSIDLRENHSADFSILLVRELDSNQSNNTFTQLSLFNTEKNSDDRIVANLGLGKRFLSEDKFSITGINAFLDYDDEGNLRSSIGFEMRNAVLNFVFNNLVESCLYDLGSLVCLVNIILQLVFLDIFFASFFIFKFSNPAL